MPVRYTLLPFVAVFMLTNPVCYTFGTFLPEKHKPAFYDSAVSFVHPITGIFPHANGGELFVWLGIAAGVEIVAPDMVTALACLLYTSPSPRDRSLSRMPSSA